MDASRQPLPAWYVWSHLVAYQLVWCIALMGGAAGVSWPGMSSGGLLIVIHVLMNGAAARLLLRLLLATGIGVAVDAALIASGAVVFAGGEEVLPPGWMIILWPCFASLFDGLLRWVPARPLLAVVLGALGGPLAYAGGHALNAVAFPAGVMNGLVAIAVAWAVATALLVLVWRMGPPLPRAQVVP